MLVHCELPCVVLGGRRGIFFVAFLPSSSQHTPIHFECFGVIVCVCSVCLAACPKKRYGPNCSKTCPWCGWSSTAQRVQCDPVNGTWHCATGWTGQCCRQRKCDCCFVDCSLLLSLSPLFLSLSLSLSLSPSLFLSLSPRGSNPCPWSVSFAGCEEGWFGPDCAER